MPQPDILKKGNEFHKLVQADWKISNKLDQDENIEIRIPLVSKNAKHIHDEDTKFGRMDMFLDEESGFVTVIEIKSTDWDTIPKKNRRRLLGTHRRQVWKYIDTYVIKMAVDVCPGIIYRTKPLEPGLEDDIIEYMTDWGIQVVWYYE